MKKWILILLAITAAVTISIFVFIPGDITVAGDKKANCPAASISRLFETTGALQKWWPGKIISDPVYMYQNTQYTIPKSNSGTLSIRAVSGQLTLAGEITAIIVDRDTCAIEFRYRSLASGLNPIHKLNYYFKAIAIKKQLDSILTALKQFAEKNENIYGISILQAKVKDSTLISTSKTFNQYPANEEIAKLIDKLKTHIASNGGVEKDFPMLNINLTSENKYDVMVAIPLAKDIRANGDIIIKKMVLGNILEAKVTGGQSSILKGEAALKNFILDYNKASPAIPFQSLVTDRVKVKDTAQWVTYVKYPVF